MTVEFLGLHHVQLAMPEGEEQSAVEFYGGLLGLSQVAKPDHLAGRGGAWFELNDVRIHLGVEMTFQPARKAHPAILVNDIAGLRTRLEAAGVGCVDDQPLHGVERFYATDPFGNRLEFLAVANGEGR